MRVEKVNILKSNDILTDYRASDFRNNVPYFLDFSAS